MGMANFGAGLFQGFPIGASLSKSAAANAAVGHSQVAGIVAAAATALVALFLTPLFENLPEAALGAIVIIAVSGMFKWKELRRLYRLRRTDFWLAAVALLGVMAFEEVLYGLLVAVLASLVAFIARTRRPQLSELGRLPGTLEFRSFSFHTDAQHTTDLLIIRPDETLFFANAASIREGIRDMIEQSVRPVSAVLVDLELTGDLDVSAAEMLEELHRELDGIGVELLMTGVHNHVEDLLDRSGALEIIGHNSLFASVSLAVIAFNERHPETLHSADRDAILARIEEMADLASTHATQLTPEETARLSSAAARLERIARQARD